MTLLLALSRKVKYNDAAMEKDFYTAKELAEKLSVNVMTIYRYIKAGKLHAYKIGKDFKIEKQEFERLLQSARTKPL